MKSYFRLALTAGTLAFAQESTTVNTSPLKKTLQPIRFGIKAGGNSAYSNGGISLVETHTSLMEMKEQGLIWNLGSRSTNHGIPGNYPAEDVHLTQMHFSNAEILFQLPSQGLDIRSPKGTLCINGAGKLNADGDSLTLLGEMITALRLKLEQVCQQVQQKLQGLIFRSWTPTTVPTR
ncbi:hypothetical protein FQA39_LY18786 [Lamprigera yunnana]|nr:hypothetical protein FQA39_LY18786 [Lamprigera yunnana]